VNFLIVLNPDSDPTGMLGSSCGSDPNYVDTGTLLPYPVLLSLKASVLDFLCKGSARVSDTEPYQDPTKRF
jgi:hypothetical protein